MSRAEYGAGSVYERKQDGKWVAVIKDPTTGKRTYRYAATERAARTELRKMRSRADSGDTTTDTRATVKAYAEQWLKERAGRNRRASTVAVYASRLNVNVIPRIGGLRMAAVTVLDIERLLDAMAADGASRYTLRDTRITLGALFTDAMRARLIKTNPVTPARLPEPTKPLTRRTSPTVEEVRQLLNETQGTTLGNLLTVLAFTGARVGEALAMTFDDIDRDHRTWRIFRTITRTRTGASVLGTATKTGRERTITLPTAAFEAIERQRIEVARARLAASWWDTTEEPLVFPTTIGTVRDSKPLRTELHDTCPWWSHSPFHSLRHFYATVTITDGALPVEVVSKVLGHASTRVTTTVYSHLMPESSQAAGEGITRALGD